MAAVRGRTALLRSIGAALVIAVVGSGFTAWCAPSAWPADARPTSSGAVANARGSGPLTPAQSDRDMVEFARCLRRHGVNEPDPKHLPGHTGLSIEIPTPGPSTRAALAACNHFIAPIARMKQAGAAARVAHELPALTHYAACMRRHDIAMLDPTPEGQLNLGHVPGITSTFGRYSPQFRAADRSCRHLLPRGVRDNGTGP